MKRILGIFGWIMNILILTALLNLGLFYWFNINLLTLISFEVKWLEITLASLIVVLGITGLGNLIIKTFLS